MGSIGVGPAGTFLQSDGAKPLWGAAPGGGGMAAISSFPLALGQDGQTVTNQDMPMQFSYVESDITVNSMSCWITQTGAAGDVYLAVYDLNGDRLGLTVAGDASVTGVLNLAMTAPLVLTKGLGVYLALYADANGSQYLRVTQRYNGAGPLIAPRPTSVGASPPANVSITNGQNSRYWVAGLA